MPTSKVQKRTSRGEMSLYPMAWVGAEYHKGCRVFPLLAAIGVGGV